MRPWINDTNYAIPRYHPEFQGCFYWDKIGRNAQAGRTPPR